MAIEATKIPWWISIMDISPVRVKQFQSQPGENELKFKLRMKMERIIDEKLPPFEGQNVSKRNRFTVCWLMKTKLTLCFVEKRNARLFPDGNMANQNEEIKSQRCLTVLFI